MKRIAAGIYEEGDWRVEKTFPEAVAAGWSPGWHLSFQGEYCQTYATKGDAIGAMEATVAEAEYAEYKGQM